MRSYLVAWLFLLAAFLLLRFWGLSSSLEVFADIGRDNWVLYEWQLRGLPPLLGPQTSVLPVNQSAVYFYFLYPAFRLLNGWIYHSQITLVIWYLAWFGAGIWLVRRDKVMRWRWWLIAVLVCFAPQVVLQNRFVWNPSLLPPLLAMSGLLVWLLTQNWSSRKAMLLGLVAALVVSLSFSALPWMLAMLIVAIWQFRRRAQWVILGNLGGLFLFQLPTLVFELRHHWLITQALWAGNFLAQVRFSIPERAHDFLTNMFPLLVPGISGALLLSILVVSCGLIWQRQRRSTNSSILIIMLAWFGLTVLLTLPNKVPMLAHYVFPLMVAFFWVMAALPRRISGIATVILCFLWLQPAQLAGYFVPAHRTVAELQSCAQQYCAQQTQPLFVSVQAGFHLFHNGPEFRYLFRRAGCQVQEIETAPAAADLMAVVVDSSSYTHGQTAYHELTLFGPSTPSATLICQPNRLEVITLKRNSGL